jgi:hydrogenase maturation protein HypF
MVRSRVTITGVVQGVGLRPFIWRRATRLGLSGFVENTASGVVIEVQGPTDRVHAFTVGLAAAGPPLARIEQVVATVVATRRESEEGRFLVLDSRGDDGPRTAVPADVATCDACLAEMRDPANRRHGHPFITCTDCGPRFTIIQKLPYDRSTTTMAAFAMCRRCRAEYHDPDDRRFHAEPIACPDCGPIVWFVEAAPDGAVAAGRPAGRPASGPILTAARALLASGGILAVRNVGGFHLACDATDPTAVARLRDRKRRPAKPLAVMVADLDAARRVAVVDAQAARLLEGPERPIVLVARRRDGGGLADAIAPGSDRLGIMLPSAPLQHLLAAGLPPLVMTSGNLADEPIAIDNADAAVRLAGIADGFLLHDRGIHLPCDDSVVRSAAGGPLPLRRSRGYAPLPIPLADDGPAILAVGGELKSAVCLAAGRRAIVSQHVGDTGTLETLAALERTVEHLEGLFGIDPEAIVADLHPGYLSSEWAARLAAARGVPFLRVQHHEAHVASLMVEHFGSAEPPADRGPWTVACFDGTGYGADGTIRGGEFFRLDADGLRHRGQLRPFPLPGGDAAIRHPWRTALAMLHAAGIPWHADLPPVRAASAEARRILARQLERGVHCPATSSVGRLFDAVAALVGLAPTVTYEAEAAAGLEALAAAGPPAGRADRLGFSMSAADGAVDWRPVVAAIVEQVRAGVPAARIASDFHAALARLVVDMAARFDGAGPPATLGLTGGVFQNAVLTEAIIAAARDTGRDTLVHHAVPPNDGGLALGQAVLGRRQVTGGR